MCCSCALYKLTCTLNQPIGVQTYSDSSSIIITIVSGAAFESKSLILSLICTYNLEMPKTTMINSLQITMAVKSMRHGLIS